MTDSSTDSRFDRDTALIPVGDGRFAGAIDSGWWIERGPNGGYIAAIVLRGLALAVEDPARTPRSLTVHYLAPPAEGPCEMQTRVERAGRRVTFVTGRLVQGDRLLALAMGAFAVSMEGPVFADISMPDALPLDRAELLPLMQTPSGAVSPMRSRYEQRWAIGGRPFTSSPVAVVG
ncbi:MAG TPA: thioesterase family protein, partial [Acidimicrobiales bacterium]|nr:thioesterase family protein [Acidimicrobiales bacterium]